MASNIGHLLPFSSVALPSAPTLADAPSPAPAGALAAPGLSAGPAPLAEAKIPSISLLDSALPALAAKGIQVPSYRGGARKEGIVHIGVGNFHRAHLAVYMDRLMASSNASDWSIGGVAMTNSSPAKKTNLEKQNFLYTVLERDAHGDRPRVVGSLSSYLTASDEPDALLNKLASADTHIVPLTVTCGGYYLDDRTGKLQTEDPKIAYEYAHPTEAPRTIYGFMSKAMARRRAAGLKPFTVMSCDNVPDNGDRVRDLFLDYTQRQDPALSAWIRECGAFPNSMVDRITPAESKSDRTLLSNAFGIDDLMPVFTESFSQLVVQDRFSDGRPELEKVGVQFSDNIAGYSRIKQRLLNATHSHVAYLGFLAGYDKVYEVISDSTFATFVIKVMKDEADRLTAVDGMDLGNYQSMLLDRLRNTAVADTAERLCRNGSAKIPKFILPAVSERLATGESTHLLSLTVAAWIRYLKGTDELGNALEINDTMAPALTKLAQEGGADATVFLTKSGFFSDELLQSQQFVGEVSDALRSLYANGAQVTLGRYLKKADVVH